MNDPRSWPEWHELFRRKHLQWRGAPFPIDTVPMTLARMEKFLWRVEREHAPEVDSAILKFGETGRWPHGASESAYFLARRLGYALEVLSVLGTPIYEAGAPHAEAPSPVPQPRAPRRTIVRWLLIQNWEIAGRRHWIEEFLLGRGR